MILFPNAKINLGLEIIRKRPDGYHDIDSVFYPIPFTDALEFVTDQVPGADQLHFSGLEIPGKLEENICWKALKVIRSRFEIPRLNLFLHKAIPMGSGLGGGSADGAFLLKGLSQHFELGISEKQLLLLAEELGSDCPFFVKNSPCHATGRGEVLDEIDLNLQGFTLVLILPGIHISTAEAYANITPSETDRTTAEIVQRPLKSWKEELRNRFEEYVLEKHPELKRIKEKLYQEGAVYASMSGSGSAFFGLFEERRDTGTFEDLGDVKIFQL